MMFAFGTFYGKHCILARKTCEKEYGQFVSTPFVVGRGLAPAGLLNSCFCNGGTKAPPYEFDLLSLIKPVLVRKNDKL